VAALLCLAAGRGAASPAVESVCGVNITVANAVVVTADSIASVVGSQVLIDGGNAVDAAVAVGFALAVTLPRAGNVGGGGFMLIRLTDGYETFLDYRERAPLGASRDMYLDDDGVVVPKASTEGYLAVGVPGTVYGLAYAHESFGKLPWKRLLGPAIVLARDGFTVGPALAKSLRAKRALLELHEESRRIFVTPDYRPGDRLVQPDLASTLERIAGDWRDFYRGKTARLLVEEMTRGGGLISMEDLSAYEVVAREPIRTTYHDFEITGAPLPSSGGIMLSQLLQMLERHDVSSLPRQTAAYVHLVSEAEKIAFRSRALYLGDTDFYAAPWRELIDPEVAGRMSDLISRDEIIEVEELEATNLLAGGSSEQTTHFSIVDRNGMAVANTYTLNGSYGSGVMVTGAGFLLNNEMDDFAIKPGHANLYGLAGGEANAVAPGKRMLSSMSPTFVYDDGDLYMVLGTPGGSTIPTTILQVFLNVVDYGMPLFDAVSAKRFHEQYTPEPIYIENGALGNECIDALLEMGHRIEIRKPIGEVQAILIEGSRLTGVSDPRGNGRAVGY
jgi:gamma-glutamyltranspeptidase/glutathione hydrolase